MSNKTVLKESHCDYSIRTYVNLGKKINDVPSGWALNLVDIRDFIPVLRYQFEGYVMIENIISPCRVKINPRLFYSGTNLKDYLRSQKVIDENREIPIIIKFNKKQLDKVHDNFKREEIDYIDTKLLVGKSYSSKGWGLGKDVVSQIFPLFAYNFMYPVLIDDIPAETRLNIQTRLFYTSKELSRELEKLSKLDSKQKVDARIILNENYLDLIKYFKEDNLSDNNCVICGNPIYKDGHNNKCFDCLDKELVVLKIKNILKFFNPSESFYEEDLLDLGFTKGQIQVIIYKFDKYDLISKEWDECYTLKDKDTINDFVNTWG